LYEKERIDSIVSSIEWKKRRIGLLIRTNRAHWLITNEITENFHDTLNKEMLNYLSSLTRHYSIIIMHIPEYLRMHLLHTLTAYLTIPHTQERNLRMI
jgi:hypothetical protein